MCVRMRVISVHKKKKKMKAAHTLPFHQLSRWPRDSHQMGRNPDQSLDLREVEKEHYTVYTEIHT